MANPTHRIMAVRTYPGGANSYTSREMVGFAYSASEARDKVAQAVFHGADGASAVLLCNNVTTHRLGDQ